MSDVSYPISPLTSSINIQQPRAHATFIYIKVHTRNIYLLRDRSDERDGTKKMEKTVRERDEGMKKKKTDARSCVTITDLQCWRTENGSVIRQF